MYQHCYVYLFFGKSPSLRRELLYSLEMLSSQAGVTGERVLVLTDSPDAFAGQAARIVDIGDRLSGMMQTWGPPYRFRAKPMALAYAIRLTGRACVLMDTDTFVRRGFDRTVAEALSKGRAMNAFVRANPFPQLRGVSPSLPNVGSYAYDAATSVMLNSGLIAARAEDAPRLEDAGLLIDELFRAGLRGNHDVEQFAVAEVFRLAGQPIALIDRNFEHYCAKWAKRYMRRLLRRRDQTAAETRRPVPFSRLRVRLFKWRWLLALWRRSDRPGSSSRR